jgi:hypothetical protein
MGAHAFPLPRSLQRFRWGCFISSSFLTAFFQSYCDSRFKPDYGWRTLLLMINPLSSTLASVGNSSKIFTLD